MATDIIRVSTHGRAATGTYTADVYPANSLTPHSTGLTVTVSSIAGIYTFSVVTPSAGTLYRYILRDSGLSPTWAVDGYFIAKNDASTVDEIEGPIVNVVAWNALATAALPLTPTTAGRSLDVSAGGEAGLDWANIGNPTTTVGLTGTTVGLTTAALSAIWNSLTSAMTTAGSIGKKLADWVIGSPMQSGAPVVLADASLTTAKLGAFALAKTTNLTGFNDLNATQVNTEVTSALTALNLQYLFNVNYDPELPGQPGLNTAYLNELYEMVVALDTQGSLTYTRIGASGAGLTAVASQVSVNDLPTSLELATALDPLPTAAETFAAVLTTALTESYAAVGVAPTLAQAIFLIQQKLGETAIVGTTQTVKKLDGTTTAASFALNSATDPTSITRAS